MDNRITSWGLIADSTRRRVTRRQTGQYRRIFNFLDLPAELRNIIYELSLMEIDSIKAFFDKHHHYLTTETDTRRQNLVPHKKAPIFLLLNRQIYQEASYLLQKQGITFHHGLLKVSTVQKVVSENVLRSVGSIEISDAGHPIIKSKILPESWNGYMRLLNGLGETLSKGHNLKKLTIDFSDHRLHEHMHECYDRDYTCGFRDGMRRAIDLLCNVRGVGCVTLKGLNPEQARQLKTRMESMPVTFQSFPREIRDMIYKESLDWSDVSTSLVKAMANWPDKKQPFPFPPRTTPTVLLLNRQIAAEALDVLHKKPLNIIFPSDHNIREQELIPSILGLIRRTTFKKAKIINIELSSWEWIFNLDQPLIMALAASKSLQKLRIYFKDGLKKSFLALPHQRYPDLKLHQSLKQLTTIRGLREVIFDGDLPLCYTDAMLHIMTTRPSAMEQLPQMKAISGAGDIVDVDDDEEEEEI